MSFPSRDRPRLSDRFRGKSGDEIMAELRQSMDEDRQKFFESPKWGRGPVSSRFPKGFPFDDDLNSGRTRLEDHLDKIAQRHPEFADQLKGWANIEKRPRHDGPSGSETSTANEEVKKKEEDTGPIGGSNLRNTVPDMQHNQPTQDEIDRAQRSQSAPPDSHQRQSSQKDVSTQKNEGQNAQQNTSPSPQPQQNQQSRAPTVRHIPIHVEGRDEPLLPKEATGTSHYPQSHYKPPSPQPQAPQPSRPARKQQPKSAEPIHIPVQINSQTQPPHHQNQQQQTQAPSQEKSPTPPPQPQAPPPPPPRLDPLDQVAAIQKEVDELKHKIESNQSLNKGDREYIYLDEMLTRHLLKLDNIETEGREEVRSARKEAIKRIQDCINFLESMPDKKQTASKSTETSS